MLQRMTQDNSGKFIAVQLPEEHTTCPGDTDIPDPIIHKQMPAESSTYPEHCRWEQRTMGYADL